MTKTFNYFWRKRW